MPVEPGQTLLHYRILEKIGEGGMGEVWKALDTTLEREVAIKVLPDAFATDPERLNRFEREAKLLASLNHSNIAAIHGLHHGEGGVHFLAMELVGGEDLEERISRGRLPVDEALDVARQIAAALETAHASGVVHRDLKPANIKLTADGKVKVLDFGLAKAMSADPASGGGAVDPTLSPTLTSAGTQAGMILGTAAYMSPEQARGRPVDRRADLWSFGCVLYECLTGECLFRGETVSDSLAAVLRKDPEWSALPGGTPPMIRLLLRRCLTRDPSKRVQDAGDARLEIEQAIEDPTGETLGLAPAAPDEPARRGGAASWLPWTLVAALVVVSIFLMSRWGGSERGTSIPRRLTIPVPGVTEFRDAEASPPALSPDGRFVVFGVTENSGTTRLWLRSLEDFTPVPLEGTDDAAYAFWSPDSRHIGFFQGGKLRRVEVATGRVQAIGGEGSSYPRGGSWNPQDRILFSPNSNTGIHVIDAAGGEARRITTVDPEIPDGSHRWPFFLPDGERFLFTVWTNDLAARQEYGGIYVATLSGDDEPRRIVSDASSVSVVPAGYLLFIRGDNLVALPFDVDTLEIEGEAGVIADDVLMNRSNGHGAFSASGEGTLVYASGEAFLPSVLQWYDRDGNHTLAAGEPAVFGTLRLSPDATRAAAAMPGPTGDNEIWIVDLVRGVRTRLASGATAYNEPMWSADGHRILYTSQERGTIDFFIRAADGSGDPERVFSNDLDNTLFDWSRDGKYLAYWPLGPGAGTEDIWIYSVERDTSEILAAGEPVYNDARFAPDGRWIAYVSNESGRAEVFLQALDGMTGGARFQVSTAGGWGPHWRDDGREIVYTDLGQRLMAVAVEVQDGEMRLGTPRELFTVDDLIAVGDATGDHERFLIATREQIASNPLHVVLNWPAGL